MTYRVKNIGIAVILAAFAGLLTIFYVTNYKRHVQHGEKSVSVLVAARDIPAGTTGSEVVEQHYLQTETVPRRTVVPGAISRPDELNNLVATEQIYRGEQVTATRFGTPTELGVRAQLKGTLRAVEMWGDSTQLLAGTLRTGDHVDFVGATSFKASRVFIRNLKVLQAPAAPAVGSKLTNSIGQKSWVMLAMTDNQAQKIQWLLNDAQSDDNSPKPDFWHLTLRPVVHDADSTDHVDTGYSILTDGLTAAEKKAFAFAFAKSPHENNGG
jgi:Flp pilus assembly protein CpaB